MRVSVFAGSLFLGNGHAFATIVAAPRGGDLCAARHIVEEPPDDSGFFGMHIYSAHGALHHVLDLWL